ncbi:MAG: TetR/AcrR family transcriptional regulator [Solirubrobacteraceae bacterium]|nr:TetR/AcrR family transcriptional regulator [Solirubrobacteraceae bacterium]
MHVATPTTRAERQAETVRGLTDAAVELFLRDGYSATPVGAIAAQAGVTTGALYANFSGKAALGLAALDRIRVTQVTSLATHLSGADTFAARMTLLGEWTEEVVATSGWPRFELEFALAAREDPELVDVLAERRAALHAGLATVIERQLAETGATARLSIDEMVRALLGLGIGIAVQRMLDPTIPVDTLPRLFDQLVSDG